LQSGICRNVESRFAEALQHFQAAQLDRAFLDADFEKVFSLEFDGFTQGHYQQAPYESLPWKIGVKSNSAGARARFIDRASRGEELALRNFRFQTIVADARCAELVLNTDADGLAQLRERTLKAHPSLENYFAFVSSLLERRKNEETTEPKVGDLLVRLDEYSLTTDHERMISEPAAKILCFLKKQTSISFEDALSESFGIRGYDSLVHNPKIYNLIHRLKLFLPLTCSISTKNQRIYFTDDGEHVRIQQGGTHTRHFPQFYFPLQSFEKKQTLQMQKKVEVDARTQLMRLFEEKPSLNRQEIQTSLGLSKTTTNRWLSTWLDTGVVRKIGSGKSQAYRRA
jgi:hypothetical protein